MPWHNARGSIWRRPPSAARPILIAQISDLHITPPGVLAYDRVDTEAALLRTIDTLNLLSPRVDLVVISGDIANSARPVEYEHARTLLGALQIPFAVIPGNHDRRTPMRKVFPDPAYGAADSALNSMRSIDELDILLIDSTVPGSPHGELDAATLAWLDGTLTTAILFLHHPPFKTGIVYTRRDAAAECGFAGGGPQTSPARAVGGGGPCSSRGANRIRRHLRQHLPGRRAGGDA